MRIWMEVTRDKYELPVAVAGTAAELAKMVGVTLRAVQKCQVDAKKRGKPGKYIRVEVDEDADDE